MDKTWLKQYPAGVPAEVDVGLYPSLVALIDAALGRAKSARACHYLGRDYSYGQVDDLARAFAAYLQSLGLQRGDRVAVMMPKFWLSSWNSNQSSILCSQPFSSSGKNSGCDGGIRRLSASRRPEIGGLFFFCRDILN